jgi:23S rRNA G2445 N2-methylase RlmL
MSDWNPMLFQRMIDPMCGSGTIIIEAALIAAGTEPGLIKYSSFIDHSYDCPRPLRTWASDDTMKSIWSNIYNDALRRDHRLELKKLSQSNKNPLFWANDFHSNSLELARAGARKANVDSFIKFSNENVKHLHHDKNYDYIITNPPWNKRELDGSNDCWSLLGNYARQHMNDKTELWTLTGDPDLIRDMNMKPNDHMEFTAAGMKLHFFNFHN